MAAKKYLDDTGLGHFWDKTAYKFGIEYIVGTQASATNVWTGVTLDKNCVNGTIPTGKVIVYRLPYDGTNTAATLNLTLPDGSTSGAKNVKYNTGSNVGKVYYAGCDIFMVFDGTYWKCSAWYDSNNYDRIRHNTNIKAASAVTAGQIIVGSDAGYKPVANGVTFSINYPILYAGSVINSGATNNNTYDVYPGVNLRSTKSGYTGTTYKMVFLVGTLSGTTFTVNSDIFTQAIPTSADNKVYAPIGLMTDSNKTIFFSPTNIYWEYRNGTFRPIANVPTLATVATSGSYNDLSNKPTIPTVNNATLTIQKNGSNVQTFTANQSTNATANITVPTKTSDITNDSGFITSSSLSPYLPKSGGTMTGATYGYFPAVATTMVGNEYNILLNGGDRYTFTQSGTGTLTDAQVKGLFDGALAPQYSSNGVNPNDPYVLLIEDLPNVHTQTGGVFGWTCRYWVPTTFKVELYDTYNSRGWVTIVEKTDIATKELFVDLRSVTGGGAFTKIRITIYNSNGEVGANGYKRWGISEIFFCHPEAITPYAYANVDKANSATKATQDANGDVINTTYAKVADIPTVNNATLTIQKNGSTVKTFTANASSNVTANITVPTNTNELTNGAGFITSSGSITGNAATATKATQDSDGNAINTTYLKKSGGDMTGAITRTLSGSGTTIAKTNLFTVSGSTDGFAADYESTTADVGITTLYTTDDANAKLSLGNRIGSTYKEAISIVDGSATVTGSVSGNAGTATKLETARTIGIGTGATGTATSFNGTANITIPITDVKESYVSWGGKQLTNNSISPDDMGCIDEFGHNKLAFLPASCIDVAYTTDGGSTWVDYGLTDAQKVKMVTTSGVSVYVGGSSNNATANNIANLKLRVRIAAGPTSGGKVYTAAKKLLINFSSQGAGGNKVQIRHRTIANYKSGTETWVNVGTYDIAGGSGWNSYSYVNTFGGSFSSQTGQIGQLEFIFYCTTLGTWGLKKPCAIDFRMIGATNWTMPSEMARAGHIYTFDENQVTTFPADVIVAGRVYPSADNSKDCGAGSKRWKDIYLSGALKNNTYTWSLPSKTGTVALTSDIPSVPTVNNGTLTIQKNGSNVQTFTANQSSNVTANITVPTKISDLTNTSGGFVTYCTCSTAAATAAKVVTLDSGDSNWALRKGDIIAVKFTNTNTASSVTLNVNSTGAKSIWYNNAAYTGSSNAITGYANRYLFYLYDGTNWVWFSDGRHDGNSDTYTTAYCSTASATAAKGASMTGYVLTANRYTVITFTNANTYAGAVTLNINSRGAKPLYINGKASSSTNYAFAAGSYIVWYDGTNYYLTTNGNIPRTLHSESGVSASTVTQTVTNDMIANGTIKFAKVDSTEFVKLTMSTTDISAGSALAKNTLYGVYV